MTIETPYNLEFYFVAFLDLLGFSNMVKSDCEAPSYSNSFIKKLFDVYRYTNEVHKGRENIDIIQFSDSIVFSMPYSKEKFPSFIDIISLFQYNLFKQGLLCRGGVAYGKHFSREGFLFSNGLIEAYRLENNYAKYPRIIISKDLLDLIYNDNITEAVSMIKENDELFFIDFLNDRDIIEVTQALESIKASNKSSDPSVKEKHRWLLEYYDFKASYSTGATSKLASPRFSIL
jgi:hypothetical protein